MIICTIFSIIYDTIILYIYVYICVHIVSGGTLSRDLPGNARRFASYPLHLYTRTSIYLYAYVCVLLNVYLCMIMVWFGCVSKEAVFAAKYLSTRAAASCEQFTYNVYIPMYETALNYFRSSV